MRISRKRKKWLRKSAPDGVVTDRNGRPGVAGVRPSFIAEQGHSKDTWASLWAVWRPGMSGHGRFVVTREWFRRYQRRVPEVLERYWAGLVRA